MFQKLFAAVLLFTAFGHSQPVVAEPLSIVYTGRLLGELEPCGCTLDSDMGGIRRLATVVDRMREVNPNLVLLSTGGLFGLTQPAHKVTNRFILEGIAALDYDAIGLLRQDFVYGLEALAAKPLPWVASKLGSVRFSGTATPKCQQSPPDSGRVGAGGVFELVSAECNRQA